MFHSSRRSSVFKVVNRLITRSQAINFSGVVPLLPAVARSRSNCDISVVVCAVYVKRATSSSLDSHQ